MATCRYTADSFSLPEFQEAKSTCIEALNECWYLLKINYEHIVNNTAYFDISPKKFISNLGCA